MTNKHSQSDGFALIITVILLSAILGLVIVSVSNVIHASRTAVLEEGFKAEGVRAAEACAKLVLLRLSNASNFSGNVAWTIGQQSCAVSGVTKSVDQVTSFTVKVEIEKIASEFEVDARLNPFQIIKIIQIY